MLFEYIKSIRKNSLLIIALGIITALATFVFTFNQPSYYNVSLSLLVSSAQNQETNDYRFDGYYTIQATDLFSNTVEAWFKSPEIVSAIYDKAKANLDKSNIKSIAKIFKAEKLAPHYVEVRYKITSEKEAKQLGDAAVGVLSEKTQLLNDSSQGQNDFIITASQPVVVLTKPPVLVNTTVGLLAGIFIGFFIGLIKDYFKS